MEKIRPNRLEIGSRYVDHIAEEKYCRRSSSSVKGFLKISSIEAPKSTSIGGGIIDKGNGCFNRLQVAHV